MYKIIGSDQKEYGPLTAEQLRQWIAEGRINAQTKVKVGGADWQTLGSLPEFKTGSAAPASPPTLSAAPAQAKTNGLAIASLILGILGLFSCGITAIVVLILGFISMGQIKKSGGQSSGHGVALAGTIVSAIAILIIPFIMAAMLLPALSKAKQRAQTISCVNNAKQLALAVLIYSSDHTNHFPAAENWCDAILPNVGSEKVFKCPAARNGDRCSYAFNAKLDGADSEKINPQTVLIFESEGGWNASGGRELMLERSRHGRGYVVAFVDGHVETVNESRLSTLRWEP